MSTKTRPRASQITRKSSFTLVLICPTPEHEEHHRMRRGSFQTQLLPTRVRQITGYNSSRRPSHDRYQLTSLVHCWNHNSSCHLTELQCDCPWCSLWASPCYAPCCRKPYSDVVRMRGESIVLQLTSTFAILTPRNGQWCALGFQLPYLFLLIFAAKCAG